MCTQRGRNRDIITMVRKQKIGDLEIRKFGLKTGKQSISTLVYGATLLRTSRTHIDELSLNSFT